MKNILFLCLATLCISCGKNSGQMQSKPATTPNMQGFTVTDFDNGIQKATKKDASGVVVEEGELLQNLKNGTWVTYHPKDSRIKTISNYINGKKNGVYLELNDRGSVELQCYYSNDVLDGKWVKYKFGSRPEKEIDYSMGKMNGFYREYHDNGKKQKEIAYKDGVQHGTFRHFNEEEKVVMEYEYKDGQKVSGGIVTPK
jgi:antitoxin component YwqK of YwqJK toxin-antitoxin module